MNIGIVVNVHPIEGYRKPKNIELYTRKIVHFLV